MNDRVFVTLYCKWCTKISIKRSVSIVFGRWKTTYPDLNFGNIHLRMNLNDHQYKMEMIVSLNLEIKRSWLFRRTLYG